MKLTSSERHTFEWGILWMLLSATSLSLSFLFLKINLTYLDYFFLLFLRFFGPLLLIVVITATGWKWKELITSKHFGLQLARSGCVLISQYGLAFYLTKNSLLNATVLLNAAPLFIPLLEWIFLKHRPGNSTIFGALLAFLGVILVLKPDSSLFTAMSGIGILAALGQAGSQVLYGLKSKKENILSSLFYLFLFTTLCSFLVFLFTSEDVKSHDLQNGHLAEWFLLLSLLLMAGGTLLNQYFRGLAYRCGRPSTLATFLYFSVFVSAFFDWLIFKKYPSTLSIIGGSLIILGGFVKIFLRSRILKKKNKK
jgi:drug/metabolite transporter (DMT)-like permease